MHEPVKDYPVRCHFYNPNTVLSSENSSGDKSRSSEMASIIRLSRDWRLCWELNTQTAQQIKPRGSSFTAIPHVGGKEGVYGLKSTPLPFLREILQVWSHQHTKTNENVSQLESNTLNSVLIHSKLV